MTAPRTLAPERWLTATFRPAGRLDGPAAADLAGALGAVAVSADMIVLDLGASSITDLGAFVAAMRPVADGLARPERCLLLLNGSPALERAVLDAGLPAAVLSLDPGA